METFVDVCRKQLPTVIAMPMSRVRLGGQCVAAQQSRATSHSGSTPGYRML